MARKRQPKSKKPSVTPSKKQGVAKKQRRSSAKTKKNSSRDKAKKARSSDRVKTGSSIEKIKILADKLAEAKKRDIEQDRMLEIIQRKMSVLRNAVAGSQFEAAAGAIGQSATEYENDSLSDL